MHGKREREGGYLRHSKFAEKESHPTHGEENAREGHHKTDGRE